MDRKFVFIGISAAAAVLSAACGNAGSSYGAARPSATPPATAPPAAQVPASPAPPQAAAGTTIAVGNSKLGRILVDGSGRTLYLFEADKGMTSACYNACAQFWPPVTTGGTPLAGAGVNGSLLGTSTRQDGSTEVTYNGHPLYYFVNDKQPADTTGEGLNNFGAAWYVLAPSGNKIDNS